MVDGGGEIVSVDSMISESAAITEFIEAKPVSALRHSLVTGPTATWF